MAVGWRWKMPGGHQALEMPGSTEYALKLSVIDPGWSWIKPPVTVARVLCELMPSRYLHGQMPDKSSVDIPHGGQ